MYPRPGGHCASHSIPDNVIIFDEDDDFPHDLDKYFDNALIYLQEEGVDLVKGDLVIFEAIAGDRNEGVAIYNGENIVNLWYDNNIDDYGCLPPDFHVIENDVPIDYWKSGYNSERGIDHNMVIWFDTFIVMEECLANINHGIVSEYVLSSDEINERNGLFGKNIIVEYGIFTKFMYNNKQYRIVLEYPIPYHKSINKVSNKIECPDIIHKIKETFIKQLKSPMFYRNPDSYYFVHDNHTLFM